MDQTSFQLWIMLLVRVLIWTCCGQPASENCLDCAVQLVGISLT